VRDPCEEALAECSECGVEYYGAPARPGTDHAAGAAVVQSSTDATIATPAIALAASASCRHTRFLKERRVRSRRP
jgi:hypothetical protein